MFDPKAAKNPTQLNVSSDVDAKATPAMIGTRDPTTGSDGRVPRNAADRMTENNGSAAFTVWVNEGATARKDTFVSTFPRVWMHARGVMDRRAPGGIVGFFKMPVIHITQAMRPPMANWIAVHVIG